MRKWGAFNFFIICLLLWCWWRCAAEPADRIANHQQDHDHGDYTVPEAPVCKVHRYLPAVHDDWGKSFALPAKVSARWITQHRVDQVPILGKRSGVSAAPG
jgi:hypothetical protein